MHRATYADIVLNWRLLGPWMPFGTDFYRRHTIGHELGHPFSLSHPEDCGDSASGQAIMRQAVCPPVFSDVRAHDKKDAGIRYG